MLKRRVQVICRFNEEEYFQLRRTARTVGFSVAAFIRRLCLTDERIVVLDGEAVRELYREINHIGNNINQIARYANTGKRITVELLERVETWLEEIKELIDEKLGGV
jgi:ribosome biogenesis SPOUT family RNA methylase Rps3